MERVIKKLLRMDLALLLVIAMVLPLLTAFAAAAPEPEQTAFPISVDGRAFQSDENCSGDGWSYDASERCVRLQNYSGGQIAASGDLVIYAFGDNAVSGSDETSLYNAIAVCGSLTVHLEDQASLIARGSSGSDQAGNGVRVSNLFSVDGKGSFGAYAGDITGDTVANGSDGIVAGSVMLSADEHTVTGGSVATTMDVRGGNAIFARCIDITGDCTVTGGNGYYAGSAVFFRESFSVGIADVTLKAGSGFRQNAVLSENGNAASYDSINTVLTNDVHTVTIRKKTLTLTLNGGGGTFGGESVIEIPVAFPYTVKLSDYPFVMDDLELAFWSDSSGQLHSCSSVYTVTEDETLNAVWKTHTDVYESTPGVTIEHSSSQKTVQVTLTEEWCADNEVHCVMFCSYTAQQQLAGYTMKTYTSGSDVVFSAKYSGEQPNFKLIALDASFRPVADNLFRMN